jgi:hypothetical protein
MKSIIYVFDLCFDNGVVSLSALISDLIINIISVIECARIFSTVLFNDD